MDRKIPPRSVIISAIAPGGAPSKSQHSKRVFAVYSKIESVLMGELLRDESCHRLSEL
jgi:hypothetical protein